jgi:hypothetical protein
VFEVYHLLFKYKIEALRNGTDNVKAFLYAIYLYRKSKPLLPSRIDKEALLGRLCNLIYLVNMPKITTRKNFINSLIQRCDNLIATSGIFESLEY